MLIVDDEDRQIVRPFHGDSGQRSQTHQHFAVAGDDQDATFRLRQSQSQSNGDGAAHRTPEVKIERMIARSGAVVGR